MTTQDRAESPLRVGIVGAGISGLTAALELARAGHTVDVFERAAAPGGMLSSFDFDGTPIERYYHFLCAGDFGLFRLCRTLGLGDRIRWVKPKTGFFCEGRPYRFTTPFDLLRFKPIPFLGRVRFGLLALEARLRYDWRHLDSFDAKPWLIKRVGQAAYDVVWEPLLRLKFHQLLDTVSAAWICHRLHRVARSKGRLGYIEGGTQVLIDALVAKVREHGAQIHCGRTVERIVVDREAVQGLSLEDGEVQAYDHVISTLPLPAVADLLEAGAPEVNDDAYVSELRGVQYMAVVCVVVKLTRKVTENFWLNVNDTQIPSNGIIEFTNLNEGYAGGDHIAYAPYYVPADHPLYTGSDEEAFEQTWRIMQRITPDLRREDVLGYRVFRDKMAQPVCTTGFLDTCPSSQSPIEGLYLLDSVYLYPEDRTQSGLILRAKECAEWIIGGELD